MIRMKVGGMILTGCAAFLMANKIVNSADSAISRVCETAKWRGYYKCWAKGKAQGEPMAPGYSRTTRPDKANFEVVDDPTGADHSKDNEPKPAKEPQSTDSVKAVVDAVKAVAEKAIDTFMKPQEEPEEASEGDLEASNDDLSAGQDTDGDEPLKDVINDAFTSGNAMWMDYSETEKETDHETVD